MARADLGVGQANGGSAPAADQVAVGGQRELEVARGVAHVVLAKQGADEGAVDAELGGGGLEAADLVVVDDSVHRADGEQGVEEEEGLFLAVAVGEGGEVERVDDRGPERLFLGLAEARTVGSELFGRGAGPGSRREHEVDEQVDVGPVDLGAGGEGVPDRSPGFRGRRVVDDVDEEAREVDREGDGLGVDRVAPGLEGGAKVRLDLGAEHAGYL